MLNIVDKIVGFFNPVQAMKRAHARFNLIEVKRLAKLEQTRRYDALARGRRVNGWISNSTSINTENHGALHTLRHRHRDLVQNNYWASRAIAAIANHTVGNGIMPNFTNVSKAQKKKLKLAWDDWCTKENCDFDGMLTLAGLEKLVMTTVANSGECLVRKRRVNLGPGRVPIQLQVQEPDFIDTSKDGYPLENGEYVYQGVVFDKMGKRVAYYLFDQHPGDNRLIKGFESKRVPATDVIHIFNTLRPGQVRGIPFGVTAMIRLKDFDDYEDAQIVRQKIAACFTAFVTSAEKVAGFVTPDPGTNQANVEKAERLEPGLIEYMKPGEEITFAQPPAVPEYSSFSKNVLLGIATAYGITYEALTGDYSGSNFSSSRMGWLEMARNVSSWQYQLMVPLFCEPIFRWFIEGATIAGLAKPEATCSWTAPRREMFDPGKEFAAIILSIQGGLTSWSEVVRELGWDPKDLLQEIADDQKAMDDLGLLFSSDPRAANKNPAPPVVDTPPEGDAAGATGSGAKPKKETA